MAESPPADVVMMDAVALSEAIHGKRVSCVEVMRACLGHIDHHNSSVNAIVSRVDSDLLLERAAERDAQLARGESMGWMHGFPHAVKDTALTKGLRSTKGSPILRACVPPADGLMVSRLREAGAIFVGKTNVPEFGLGSHTTNPIFGPTRNPYDHARSAGGSSGGAASALALRMVPVADGSDFGGSLRNPAGWNNVFGFRPTAGRVPHDPTGEVFVQQLVTEGPMARNAADLAMLLSVQAGPDRRAPLSLPDAGASFAAPLARDVTGVRVGWLGDLGGLPTEPGVLDTCEAALRALSSAGVIVERAALSMAREEMWETWLVHRHWLTAGALLDFYNDPVRRALLKPEAIWEVEGGLQLSALDVYRASARRSALYRAFLALFEHFDLLAVPTAQLFPFDVDLPWPREVAGASMDTYHRWMEITFPPTLSGCPVAAVPAGFGGAHDLPMGLQLIAPRGEDFALLQFVLGYEQATAPLRDRPPPALHAS
jgi:amidase